MEDVQKIAGETENVEGVGDSETGENAPPAAFNTLAGVRARLACDDGWPLDGAEREAFYNGLAALSMLDFDLIEADVCKRQDVKPRRLQSILKEPRKALEDARKVASRAEKAATKAARDAEKAEKTAEKAAHDAEKVTRDADSVEDADDDANAVFKTAADLENWLKRARGKLNAAKADAFVTCLERVEKSDPMRADTIGKAFRERQGLSVNALKAALRIKRDAVRERAEACRYGPDVPDDVAAMNKGFAAVWVKSKLVIAEKARFAGDMPMLRNRRDFAESRANDGGAYDAWWESPHRDTRRELVFDPGAPEHPDRFNLWSGFPYKGVEGDWSLYRQHLLNSICAGEVAHFQWFMSWLADIFQNPGRKPGSAVVLRSDAKGTGKSHVMNCASRLLGPYSGGAISKSKQIVGQFNGLVERSLFTVLDEATFAGSHSDDAALKNLITEERITVEEKGIPAYSIRNYTRFGFTTNGDWAIRADNARERRYFVLDVSAEHANDESYWRPLIELMGARSIEEPTPGLLAMLYDLENWETPAWVNLFKPPHTAALHDQIAASMPLMARWWLSAIQAGKITNGIWHKPVFAPEPGSAAEAAQLLNEQIGEIAPTDFHEALVEYARRTRAAERVPSENALGKFLSKMGVERVRRRVGSERTYTYNLPAAAEAEARFADQFGTAVLET